MARKRVVVLGATGSIGRNTLRVIRSNPEDLQLVGIAGHSRYASLAKIAREFGLRHVAIFDHKAYNKARQSDLFGEEINLKAGMEGLNEIAALPEADVVVVAVVGTLGLCPTLTAIAAGKEIALASKEVLVMAGKFVMAAARTQGVRLLPIDSEHNAIFQCQESIRTHEVARLILTASGGPFRDFSEREMLAIRPEETLKHPNWSMGPKITVDSSTMANKGLEIIEAHWLFGMEPKQIDVVVHPQSIVHSMVEFVDGSIIAQLARPSMTFAIQHTLLYPHRVRGVDPPLNFRQAMQLDFYPPDPKRFPCLRLARAALEAGGTAPAVFNAANEVAVKAFLENRISYLGIGGVIDTTLEKMANFDPSSLEGVLEADHSARRLANTIVEQYES